MPNPFPKILRGIAWLGASVLLGCFGSEPDDSPYTVPRGEAFEALQLEIEADGTPLILAQVGMYMAHKAPVDPDDRRVRSHNFRSILLRRTAGGWNATALKNIQANQSALPSLIPDPEGRFQAFVPDGGQVKRYVFGNGAWYRAPGTEWPEGILDGYFGYSSGNWNRHPRIAVAGANLLLTVHENWQRGHWVMEGSNHRVVLDSTWVYPAAFHSAAGYRALVATGASRGGIDKGDFQTTRLHYFRWYPGADRAEKQDLGGMETLREAFFARHHGRTAFYVSTLSETLIHSLDDSGKVVAHDTLPLPKETLVLNPMIAADTAGCVHGLNYLPDSGATSIRYLHWNSCEPDAQDTLSVPKPIPSKSYQGHNVKLRLGPDGTPVAALILRESRIFDFDQSTVEPTHLFLAEFRGGKWNLEKLDERTPPQPLAKTRGQTGGF